MNRVLREVQARTIGRESQLVGDSEEKWEVSHLLFADETVLLRSEFNNAIRSIEWDLEDLEDTIKIVEKNPKQFKIEAADMELRKKFVADTKQEIAGLKTEGLQQTVSVTKILYAVYEQPNVPPEKLFLWYHMTSFQ